MTQEAEVYLAGVRWRSDMGGLEQTFSTGGGLPLNQTIVLVDGGTGLGGRVARGQPAGTPVPRS